ncbi:hypothetical protein Q3G72_012362 [Acer saccharum]|nr:hypothetical protein Q3G72_012362 [Acer saccharum]
MVYAHVDPDMDTMDTKSDIAEAEADVDADMFFSLWWTPMWTQTWIRWTPRLTWTRSYRFGRPWMDLGITNDSAATCRL